MVHVKCIGSPGNGSHLLALTSGCCHCVSCRRFDAQDFCGLLVGLYRLRYNPGQQWLDLYAQSLAAKVHLLPANKHALIVTVLRAMGYSGQGRPFAWIMDEAAVAAICNRGGSSRTGGAASDDSGDVQIQ